MTRTDVNQKCIYSHHSGPVGCLAAPNIFPLVKKTFAKGKMFWNLFILVVLFCFAAVIFPLGFSVPEVGGQPYQLPNSFQIGVSYIMFVLSLWISVISELFAKRVCMPHF